MKRSRIRKPSSWKDGSGAASARSWRGYYAGPALRRATLEAGMSLAKGHLTVDPEAGRLPADIRPLGRTAWPISISATRRRRRWRARIRDGKLSPVDLVENTLARIEEVNPKLNCFCFVYPEEALRQGARRRSRRCAQRRHARPAAWRALRDQGPDADQGQAHDAAAPTPTSTGCRTTTPPSSTR